MEKLYRAQIPRHRLSEQKTPVDNPIELDNKFFNIEDGSRKSLDYLDYYGTLAKGTLAAEGAIKLCPACKGKYIEHYGVSIPYNERPEKSIVIDTAPEDDDYQNEWDNIFLNKENDFYTDSGPDDTFK